MKKIKEGLSDIIICSVIAIILSFSIFMIKYNYEYRYKIKQDIKSVPKYEHYQDTIYAQNLMDIVLSDKIDTFYEVDYYTEYKQIAIGNQYIITTIIKKSNEGIYINTRKSKRVDLCFNLQYEREKAKHYIDSVKAEKRFIRDIKRKCR